MQCVCDDRWEPVTANVLTSRHPLNMELHDWDGVRHNMCVFLLAHCQRPRVKAGGWGGGRWERRAGVLWLVTKVRKCQQ